MTIDMQTLIDRAAISDVVLTYATAVDTRDWDLLRSLFTDPLYYDFRTYGPDLHGDIPFDTLLERCKLLANLDATQHISSNHRHTIAGDRATCVSYMQAGHFLRRADGDHHFFLYGYYTNELVRTGGGWKIARYGLTVTANSGDPRVMEWAGL